MATSSASAVITKLVTFVEDAAKSSISTTTTAKLNTVSALLGEGGDILASYLESKYSNLDAVLSAIETIEDDATKLEADVQALIAAIKNKTSTTDQAAVADPTV